MCRAVASQLGLLSAQSKVRLNCSADTAWFAQYGDQPYRQILHDSKAQISFLHELFFQRLSPPRTIDDSNLFPLVDAWSGMGGPQGARLFADAEADWRQLVNSTGTSRKSLPGLSLDSGARWPVVLSALLDQWSKYFGNPPSQTPTFTPGCANSRIVVEGVLPQAEWIFHSDRNCQPGDAGCLSFDTPRHTDAAARRFTQDLLGLSTLALTGPQGK